MEVGVQHKKFKSLCVIPARYKSSRFPGKPLVEINGIPMIKRTYMQANQARLIDEIVVATEDKKIFNFCKSEDINVVLTSDKCLTGTDRLVEVIQKKEYNNYDLFFNIQGDEPVINPIVIDQLVREYEKFEDEYMVFNLYKLIHNKDDINSNTIIKVIVNEKDELIYMSRLPVPYSNNFSSLYKMQVPVYCFTLKALKIFSMYKKTINEQFEDIELLRFLDLGYKIKMSETTATSISVDIPSDVMKVEKHLNNLGVSD